MAFDFLDDLTIEEVEKEEIKPQKQKEEVITSSFDFLDDIEVDTVESEAVNQLPVTKSVSSEIPRSEIRPTEPHELERLESPNRIKQIIGDVGMGFISDLSSMPKGIFNSAIKYSRYRAKKFIEEHPIEAARAIALQKEHLTEDELKKGRTSNEKMYEIINRYTDELEKKLPQEQQERFATKLGAGFSSLPQSLVPGLIAVRTWGDSYDQAKQQGKTDDQAANFAGIQALLQEASERIGGAALGKVFKGGAKLLIKAGKSFLSESTQELSQEGIAIVIEKAFNVKSGTPVFKRLVEAWGIGGLTGAGGAVVTAPLSPRTPIQKAREQVKEQIKVDLSDAVAEGDPRKILKLEKEKQSIINEEIKEREQIGTEKEKEGILGEEQIKKVPVKDVFIEEVDPSGVVQETEVVPVDEFSHLDGIEVVPERSNLKKDIKKEVITKKETTEKVKKTILTEKDINKRVKELRKKLSESTPILFKKDYSQGIKIPVGLESDFKDILKKHKIKISKNGIPLDTAIQEFSSKQGTSADLNEFMQQLESTEAQDLSFANLRQQVLSEIDTRFESLKTDRQASLLEINRKFKEKIDSQQNIKSTIVKFAKEFLVLRDRGKLLSTVKNAKTPKDLGEAIDLMNNLVIKTNIRSLRADIKKELKKTKPLKVSGKPKGKFTPEIQAGLDVMRSASKLTVAQAQEKLAKNLEDKFPSPEIARENIVLNMVGNLEQLTEIELESNLKEIRTLKETGRSIAEQKKVDFREDINKKKTEIREVLRGESIEDINVREEKEKDDPKTKIDADNVFKKRLKTLFSRIVGYNDLLDSMSFNDKKSKVGQSNLNKIAKVSDFETKEKGNLRKTYDDVRNIIKDVYNIKNDRQLIKKFQKDSIRDIKIGKLELSRAEARKRFMEFQDPTLDETFKNMGYTERIKKKIVDSLTSEDKKLAQSQLDFYKDYYNETNKVYSALNGINLPKNEFYSPIKRLDIGKTVDSTDFLNEVNHRVSISPGSLKSRVNSEKKLDQTSDIEVLMKHINEMEHYKVWAEKIRELNSIFGDTAIRNDIEEEFGSTSLMILDNFIEKFTSGRIENDKNLRWLDKRRSAFTQSVLALKPALMIKQLASFPAYAENIPIKEFVSGMVDFAKNPKRSFEILSESEVLKARGENITRDMRTALKSKEFSAFRKSPSLKNSLMLFTKLGDKGAIVMGGWSNYKYARKQGKSHQEALKFFEEQTSQAQQSADLSQQSFLQSGNSFVKLFTMFTSSQNQYFRRELSAVRNLAAGRISKKQFAKTIAIYHFVLPMLFQFVSNGFKWDKEDQLRAGLVGSLNGIFIFKDVIDGLVRSLQKENDFGFELPLYGSAKEINKALRKVDFDNIMMDDLLEAIKHLSIAGGSYSGYGVKQIMNSYEGVKDFIDGDKAKGIKRFLGWSKYAIDKSGE